MTEKSESWPLTELEIAQLINFAAKAHAIAFNLLVLKLEELDMISANDIAWFREQFGKMIARHAETGPVIERFQDDVIASYLASLR